MAKGSVFIRDRLERFRNSRTITTRLVASSADRQNEDAVIKSLGHYSLLTAALSFVFCTVSMADQDLVLERLVEGEAAAGSSRAFTVNLQAGDLIAGTIELVRGSDLALNVFDPAGVRIKSENLYAAFSTGQPIPFGFAAQVSGTYRLQISGLPVAKESTAGAFVMRTDPAVPPSVRMRGVHAHPTIRYISPRIEQLRTELEARPDALARFWADARAGGGPLVEPFGGGVVGPVRAKATLGQTEDSVLVTFLWKETFETHNVRVSWPQPRPDDFFLTRLPGTDIWYKTILVRRGSRFQYSLMPNARPEDERFVAQRDPLNPRLAWDDEDDASLLELSGAPDESWFRKTPTARGVLSEARVIQPNLPDRGSEGLKGPVGRTVRIYTPPGYSASGGPYPVLVLFHATYLLDFEAVPSLNNLISAGRIRPVIVCFFPDVRPIDVGPNATPAFGEALARDFIPSLRQTYPISRNPRDIIIGGFSAGATGAARIAFAYPDVFGNVLSQSAALRGEANPTILAYRDADRRPIRFYMDVGLYENIPAELPVNELALTEGSSTIANRHFRDVLKAKGYEVIYSETGGNHDAVHFRATFPEGLLALLEPGAAQR